MQSGYFNEYEVFQQLDRKSNDKVLPQDLINFLGVHRIASNERECQYLIWLAGSPEPHLSHSQYLHYLTNGHPQNANYLMSNSGIGLQPADQLLRNNSERELAHLLEKELEYYRSIEQLREQFVQAFGFQFGGVTAMIDREKRGVVNAAAMIGFVQQHGVEFSREEFEAVARKLKARDASVLTYKEIMRAFSPFEPLNFPTYRRQGNLQRAMDYITEKVRALDIEVGSAEADEDKRRTGFQRVVEDFRNPATQGAHVSSKYFYDKNYYNELKQYKASYYDPNKDVKKKLQTEMVGPQYHDHFFSDYYLYLEERNKTEHYFNKFGKRYAFQPVHP